MSCEEKKWIRIQAEPAKPIEMMLELRKMKVLVKKKD